MVRTCTMKPMRKESNIERDPAGSVQVTPGITVGRTKPERRVGSGNVRKGAIRSIKAVKASDEHRKSL